MFPVIDTKGTDFVSSDTLLDFLRSKKSLEEGMEEERKLIINSIKVSFEFTITLLVFSSTLFSFELISGFSDGFKCFDFGVLRLCEIEKNKEKS